MLEDVGSFRQLIAPTTSLFHRAVHECQSTTCAYTTSNRFFDLPTQTAQFLGMCLAHISVESVVVPDGEQNHI